MYDLNDMMISTHVTKILKNIFYYIAILLCILVIFLLYFDLNFKTYVPKLHMEAIVSQTVSTEFLKEDLAESVLSNSLTESWRIAMLGSDDVKNDTKRVSSFLQSHNVKCNEQNGMNKSEFEGIPRISAFECSYPYVEMEDNGRLGNQICRYMSLWIFKKHFGARVFISPKTHSILHEYFPKLAIGLPPGNNICSPIKVSSSTEGSYRKIYDNFYYSINYIKSQRMKMAPLIKYRNFIIGSPCESSLVAFYREELKSDMSIDPDILSRANTHMTSILMKHQYSRQNITLVSVHVRRTDYIKYAKRHEQILPGRLYFQQVMNSFTKRYDSVVFAIFSDDVKWCKSNLNGPDIIYPGKGGISSPIFDFALITLCDHHIIGLGTYSFTSAFLGGGSIVYGVSWRHIKNTKLSQYLCSSFFTPVKIV